jgi:ABC-type transport system involved in multi-copper enzyme maturation permease subunit
VIVQERAARTWDLLLTTPIPRTDLLLAKFWVGLSRQTSFLSLITFMQIFPLLAILGQVSSQLGNVHGIAPLILYGFTALVFVVARLQEFLLAGMIGLYASLVAESWGLASIGSVAIALVVYLIRIFITYILVIGIAGGKVIDLSGVLFAGLPFLITGGKNLWAGYALCIIAVIVQEAVIRVVHTLLIREMRVRR